MQDEQEDCNALVSVSTTFFPDNTLDPLPPDLALLTTDSVFFYVHSYILLNGSDNSFNSLISTSLPKTPGGQNEIFRMAETSIVLNVVLHCIYNLPCVHYDPSFETLMAAVNALKLYGINAHNLIVPSSPLYTTLLSQAPLRPLDTYILASTYDLYDLAVATSSHLLSFPLASLTDEAAKRMDPIYLKRLFFLHFGRVDALKRILFTPPHPHAPTSSCGFTEQKKLTRAWAFAAAYLAWDARPGTFLYSYSTSPLITPFLDIPTSVLESALTPLEKHLACDLCREALSQRIKILIRQWSIVKVSSQIDPSFDLYLMQRL